MCNSSRGSTPALLLRRVARLGSKNGCACCLSHERRAGSRSLQQLLRMWRHLHTCTHFQSETNARLTMLPKKTVGMDEPCGGVWWQASGERSQTWGRHSRQRLHMQFPALTPTPSQAPAFVRSRTPVTHTHTRRVDDAPPPRTSLIMTLVLDTQ